MTKIRILPDIYQPGPAEENGQADHPSLILIDRSTIIL